MNALETEHGIFTANPSTGQTAEEVYVDWLAGRDAPPLDEPSYSERIKVLEEMVMQLLLMS